MPSDHESRSSKDEEGEQIPPVDTEKQNDLQPTQSIAETLSLPHEIACIGIVCCAQLTTQVALGQVLSILHVIGDSFGVSEPGELSWLIAAYSLTVGSFILFSGRLGDLFGYKKMIIIGYSWFAFWSMVAGCAVYSNHVLFNFARALQGIGPSILLPNALALLGATYAPGRRKNMVFALFGAAAPGGSILGSCFGGLFALTWWPWTFWSFALALLGLAIAGSIILPNPPPKSTTTSSTSPETTLTKLQSLDLPGALTGITALVLINIAWNQAPLVAWSTPYVPILLVLGLALIPLFFYIELRLAPSPLIPFDALTPDVGFVLACIACGWGCFGIWVFYIWQFAEILRFGTPLQVTAWVSPVAVSGALASVVTGLLLGKIGPAMVMTCALSAFLVGTILIATAPVDQVYWAQFFVCTVIMPWGMDMSFPAATLILSDRVRKEHQGIGASLVNTVVNYSISLALGFAGTVEVHVNQGGRTREDVLRGYRGAWYMGIGLATLGLVISLVFVVKERRGRK